MSTSSSDSECSPTPLHREWAMSLDKKGNPIHQRHHREWAEPVEDDTRTSTSTFSTFKDGGSGSVTLRGRSGSRRSESSSASSSPIRHSYSGHTMPGRMSSFQTDANFREEREERIRSSLVTRASPTRASPPSSRASPTSMASPNRRASPTEKSRSITTRSNGETSTTPIQQIQPWKSIGQAAAQRVAEKASPGSPSSPSLRETTHNSAVINRDKLSSFPAEGGGKLNRTVKDIINREYYGSVTFNFANQDVDFLLKDIDATIKELNNCKRGKPTDEFPGHKEKLVSESRQFVTDSKLLVSSATQSTEKLIQNVNASIHTLAKIVLHSENVMLSMSSIPQAHLLGARVKDVANAYKDTVTAAQSAAGRPLSDPQMKNLMKQATLLASILSALMKVLKALENS